jgi:hypothetical protein
MDGLHRLANIQPLAACIVRCVAHGRLCTTHTGCSRHTACCFAESRLHSGLDMQGSGAPILSNMFESVHIPASVAPLRIISHIFDAIYRIFTLCGLFLVLKHKRKPFLPLKPYTLSSQILYLCHGTNLLEDLRGQSTLSKKARDTRLEQKAHKYALGWVEDEAKHALMSALTGLRISEGASNYRRRTRTISSARVLIRKLMRDFLPALLNRRNGLRTHSE